MNDALLYSAGILGIALSLIHGWLGETRVVQGVTAKRQIYRLNQAVFHLSTLYWLGAGLMLLIAPQLAEPARVIVAWSAAFIYGAAAVANAWATNGKHFGGYCLLVVALLAALGA